jgi:hypothetical protein
MILNKLNKLTKSDVGTDFTKIYLVNFMLVHTDSLHTHTYSRC